MSIIAKVAKLYGPNQLVWEEEALPEQVDPDRVLCRTLVSAISPGTELAAFQGLPPLRNIAAYPRVQGYCNVAEVLNVGGNVTAYKVGDRVLTFTSHRSHFVIPAADILLRLPADVNADIASVTYLFHLGYNAVLRGGVRAGSRVVVLGGGTVGLASTSICKLAGATVLVISDYLHARTLAKQFGANEILDRNAAVGRERWADVVICTTSSWSDWNLALRLSDVMGTIAVLGFPGRGLAKGELNPLDSQYFYSKQLTILAVGLSPQLNDSRGFLRFNERANLQFLFDRIHSGELPASQLISGKFPASELETAYARLIERHNSPVTFVLEW